MVNNIYCLKNVLSGRFADIFEFPTDAYAEARVKEAAAKSPEHFNLDELELYRLGAIEVETGKITSMEEPILIEFSDKNVIQQEEENIKTE